MKALISLAIIVGVYMVFRAIILEYRAKSGGGPAPTTASAPAASNLQGMPSSLEPSLEAAQKQGAQALKAWLNKNRPYINDPRLGAIELDYALLVSRQNSAEAKEVFLAVKARTPANSLLAERVKRLEKSFP